MCTAVSFTTKDHYFGRNLDFEFSYEETVTITPRNYRFSFCNGKELHNHYAIIGMAYVVDGYPLYYDAVNEAGLGMAGLLFAGNAVYSDRKEADKDNVASYEFISWILGQCADVDEVKTLLDRINLTSDSFRAELPPSPLHWMIASQNSTITVEAVADGLKIYDNPVHVMTNNPPFDYQLMNLNNYMHLSIDVPANSFSSTVNLAAYSRGMGALGLPGDLSSMSRFVRAAFVRMNSVCGDSEEESISQFFHILGSVCQQRGCVRLMKKEREGQSVGEAGEKRAPVFELNKGRRIAGESAQEEQFIGEFMGKKRSDGESMETEAFASKADKEETAVFESTGKDCSAGEKAEYEITIYSSCCNTDKGIYYYTTYGNSQITAVDMHREDLESDKLVSYPLIKGQQIRMQNGN